MNIDKIFYINLDRRFDRKEHFILQCQKHNLPMEKIEKFPAIDGRSYIFKKEELDLFHVNIHRSEYRNALMGNQLSHYKIMKNMIKNKYKIILVFQDDIILRNNFLRDVEILVENLPDNSEIINIAFHKSACLAKSIPINLNDCKNDEIKMRKCSINEHVIELTHTTNPCSLGYLITTKGAENYIKHFEKTGFDNATDHCMNDYLKQKSKFWAGKKILATGNHKLGSDIFTS